MTRMIRQVFHAMFGLMLPWVYNKYVARKIVWSLNILHIDVFEFAKQMNEPEDLYRYVNRRINEEAELLGRRVDTEVISFIQSLNLPEATKDKAIELVGADAVYIRPGLGWYGFVSRPLCRKPAVEITDGILLCTRPGGWRFNKEVALYTKAVEILEEFSLPDDAES